MAAAAHSSVLGCSEEQHWVEEEKGDGGGEDGSCSLTSEVPFTAEFGLRWFTGTESGPLLAADTWVYKRIGQGL